MGTPATAAKDKRVEIAIHHWASRFVASGIPLTDLLDNLTPPHNAQRLASEVSGPCQLLIVKGGNHVANNRRYLYQAQTADWMAQRLGVPKR